MTFATNASATLRRMRHAMILCAAAAGLVLGLAGAPRSANAAEFSKKDSGDPNVVIIRISGIIHNGDTDKFKAYVADVAPKGQIVVYLDSRGGSIEEGMKLGRYFYRTRIGTVIDSEGRCLHACALAFLGGRDQNGKPHRVKYASGMLVFNVFIFNFEDGKYSADDVWRLQVRLQRNAQAIIIYLRSIGAEPAIVAKLFAGGVVFNPQAQAMGIAVPGDKTAKRETSEHTPFWPGS